MSVTVSGQPLAGRLRERLAGPRRVPSAGRPTRRVRQEVRDGVAVVVFTAAASSALAAVFAALVRLAG